MNSILVNFVILSFLLCSCSSNSLKSKYNNSNLPTGPVRYQALESWKSSEPDNFMRLEQFQVSKNSKLAVYFLPGAGGTVKENIQRWRNQFLVNESREELLFEQYNFKAMPLTEFHMVGDFKKSVNPFNPNAEKDIIEAYAMYTVIAELEEGKWFFKFLGPKAEISSLTEQIREFISSFQV